MYTRFPYLYSFLRRVKCLGWRVAASLTWSVVGELVMQLCTCPDRQCLELDLDTVSIIT